jgi:hypothetical protein
MTGSNAKSAISANTTAFKGRFQRAGASNGAAGLRVVSLTEHVDLREARGASAAPLPKDEMRKPEDIAYAAERIRRCREILDAAQRERESRERPIAPVPRRPKVPGQDWCYRCAGGPHLITEADHRPTWPLRRSLNGNPAVPLDNWPARSWEGDAAAEWQEAAE